MLGGTYPQISGRIRPLEVPKVHTSVAISVSETPVHHCGHSRRMNRLSRCVRDEDITLETKSRRRPIRWCLDALNREGSTGLAHIVVVADFGSWCIHVVNPFSVSHENWSLG